MHIYDDDNDSDDVDDYTRTSARIKSMREEIKSLKLRLAKLGMDEDQLIASGNLRNVEIVQPVEAMDDFYLISQDAAVTDNQVKSIKTFLRNITGGSSG